MNLQHERIARLCKQLKLERISRDRGALAQHTATTDASLADFLEQLLHAELGAREERKRQTLTKFASLPAIKTLEQRLQGSLLGSRMLMPNSRSRRLSLDSS